MSVSEEFGDISCAQGFAHIVGHDLTGIAEVIQVLLGS